MKKIKIHSCYNYGRKDGRSEVHSGESMTRPNETMTIKDILKRNAAGLVQFDRNAIYMETELEHISKFNGRNLDIDDFAELQSHVNRLNESVARQIEERKAYDKQLAESKKKPTQEAPPQEETNQDE